MKLSARFGLLEQFRVLAPMAVRTERVASCRLGGSGRHVRLPPLRQWIRKNGCAYYCERVHPFWSHVGEWTAHNIPKQLVLLDIGYVVDSVDPSWRIEKRVVFFAILAVVLMVIWRTRKKGLYDHANFSNRDLILFFRHQLIVKIRCDRKRLDRTTFDKRQVNAVSLLVLKVATLESSFLFFLCMATMVWDLRDPTPSESILFPFLPKFTAWCVLLALSSSS